jgi:hypothetical protein
MIGGGVVTVAASSSVLVCIVSVIAVAAVEVMGLRIEPSFPV